MMYGQPTMPSTATGNTAPTKWNTSYWRKGDLRVGLDKTEYRYHDWNCFDNFKLLYVAKPTAIREVTDSAEVPVDVYTVSGVKVRSAVMPHEAVNGLPHGIYIVGTRKFAIK